MPVAPAAKKVVMSSIQNGRARSVMSVGSTPMSTPAVSARPPGMPTAMPATISRMIIARDTDMARNPEMASCAHVTIVTWGRISTTTAATIAAALPAGSSPHQMASVPSAATPADCTATTKNGGMPRRDSARPRTMTPIIRRNAPAAPASVPPACRETETPKRPIAASVIHDGQRGGDLRTSTRPSTALVMSRSSWRSSSTIW
jgi:hypothetical protein